MSRLGCREANPEKEVLLVGDNLAPFELNHDFLAISGANFSAVQNGGGLHDG
jgi:hypothetical protein